MNKKIFIVNSRYIFQQTTGVQRYAFECSKALESLPQFDVKFVAHKGLIKNEYASELNIKQFGFFRGHLWEQIELPIYCFFKNATLINFCGTPSIFFKNQIYAIHDLSYLKYPKFFNFLYAFIYKTIIKFTYLRIKKILCVSNFTKNEAYKLVGKRDITIVNNSFNHLKNIQSLKSDVTINHDNFILTVGSIDPRKNVNCIIESYLLSNRSHKLIIVGTRNKVFTKFISENDDIDKNIIFTGFVSDELLIEYYKKCLCFVSASFYEGFDIPTVEALYFNKPIVTSDIPVHKEILKDYPYYISPNNNFDLEEAIKKAIQNKELGILERKKILSLYTQANQQEQLEGALQSL